MFAKAGRGYDRPTPGILPNYWRPHDPAHRPLADRAATAGRSRPRRRERGPRASGRQVRRDVDADELHVPVVQLPQPPGRTPVLRPHREHRGRGIWPHRARRGRDQHDADRQRHEGRPPPQQSAVHRRRQVRAAAGLHGQAVERRLRHRDRRPRRGPDAQLLPRDRRAQQQAQGLRDGRPPGGARADRLPARARRRPPGRLRPRGREADGRRPHEDVPEPADPDRQDPRVPAAHPARRPPADLPLLAGGLQGDRRGVQRPAPRDGRGPRGRRPRPRGRAAGGPPAGDRRVRAGLCARGDRADRGEAAPGRRPPEGADRRRRQQRRQRRRRRQGQGRRHLAPPCPPPGGRSLSLGGGGQNAAMSALVPPLADPSDKEAVRFGDRALTYAELAGAAAAVADAVAGKARVAVFAESSLETCVAAVGALLAGVPFTPVNPKAGERELEHISSDSAPALVLTAAGVELPPALADVERIDVDPAGRGDAAALPDEPDDEAPAAVVYTSGTTGPPKGAVLPRRAISSNLDALADAWEWTGDDVLAHALPLFHVHGLILGVLGPLRLGGAVHHLGRFDSKAMAAELGGPATMMFGVPTMFHRLAADAEKDRDLARGMGEARVLVSGSAALPATEHARIEKLTGQRIVERYGMSETLMNTAVRFDGERRPGTVGIPLSGVELRLVDDDGAPIEGSDDETVGEIQVRGPNLFLEYLNRPDATAEVMRDGWFATGDMATRAGDGYIRIVGRRATDLIKSGGYKIGAGEIEGALLEHPGVAEVAVTGEPDEDLGERIVAWVVPADGELPGEKELADHVARLLTPHKRPRVVRYLDELPRNAMGKVMKKALGD